jgi:hypothetical protein
MIKSHRWGNFLKMKSNGVAPFSDDFNRLKMMNRQSPMVVDPFNLLKDIQNISYCVVVIYETL